MCWSCLITVFVLFLLTGKCQVNIDFLFQALPRGLCHWCCTARMQNLWIFEHQNSDYRLIGPSLSFIERKCYLLPCIDEYLCVLGLLVRWNKYLRTKSCTLGTMTNRTFCSSCRDISANTTDHNHSERPILSNSNKHFMWIVEQWLEWSTIQMKCFCCVLKMN